MCQDKNLKEHLTAIINNKDYWRYFTIQSVLMSFMSMVSPWANEMRGKSFGSHLFESIEAISEVTINEK